MPKDNSNDSTRKSVLQCLEEVHISGMHLHRIVRSQPDRVAEQLDLKLVKDYKNHIVRDAAGNIFGYFNGFLPVHDTNLLNIIEQHTHKLATRCAKAI